MAMVERVRQRLGGAQLPAPPGLRLFKALHGMGADLRRLASRGRSWAVEKPREQPAAEPEPRPTRTRAARTLTRRRLVKRPGIRGGKFYYDHHGDVQYGQPPSGEKGFATLAEFYTAHADWTPERHTAQRISHAGLAHNDKPWNEPTPQMRLHEHLGELHRQMAQRKARGDRPFSDRLPLEQHLGAARRLAGGAHAAIEREAAIETAPYGMTEQITVLRRAGWEDVSRTARQIAELDRRIGEAQDAHAAAAARLARVLTRARRESRTFDREHELALLAARQRGETVPEPKRRKTPDRATVEAEVHTAAVQLAAAREARARVTHIPNTFRHPRVVGHIVVKEGSQGWEHWLPIGNRPQWEGNDSLDLAAHLRTKAPMRKGMTMRIFGRWRKPTAIQTETAAGKDGTLAKAHTRKKCPHCPCANAEGGGAMAKCGEVMHPCGDMAKCDSMHKAGATVPPRDHTAIQRRRHAVRETLWKAAVLLKRGTPKASTPTRHVRRARATMHKAQVAGDRRMDLPAHVYLEPEQRQYPVKARRDGAWHYDTDLLTAAAREARMHGHPALAARADAIRTRHTGGAMAKALVAADHVDTISAAFAQAFAPIRNVSPVQLPAFLMETHADHVVALLPVGKGGADILLRIPYAVDDTRATTFKWAERTPVQAHAA
jgi:hypothetical protein